MHRICKFFRDFLGFFVGLFQELLLPVSWLYSVVRYYIPCFRNTRSRFLSPIHEEVARLEPGYASGSIVLFALIFIAVVYTVKFAMQGDITTNIAALLIPAELLVFGTFARFMWRRELDARARCQLRWSVLAELRAIKGRLPERPIDRSATAVARATHMLPTDLRLPFMATTPHRLGELPADARRSIANADVAARALNDLLPTTPDSTAPDDTTATRIAKQLDALRDALATAETELAALP